MDRNEKECKGKQEGDKWIIKVTNKLIYTKNKIIYYTK